ncbi:MAG: hypothetical protein GX776_05780 [Oxalobacter sp.]|nr:hypothetical protein [Oxalobacter sp.]
MSTVPACVDTGMAGKAITSVSVAIPSGVAADRAPTILAKKARTIPMVVVADAADVTGMGMLITDVVAVGAAGINMNADPRADNFFSQYKRRGNPPFIYGSQGSIDYMSFAGV